MSDHKATPEQWADIEQARNPVEIHPGVFVGDRNMTIACCLFELRVKVEALEGKYETCRLATLEWGKDVENLQRWSDQHLQRIMALEAAQQQPHQDKLDRLIAMDRDAPAGSLVERVALAISGIEYGLERDEEAVNWASEARAAIREVAAWMRENEVGYNAVRWLEREAK